MADVSLQTKLALAKAEVGRLEAQIANASCAEAGHDWRFVGGRNAGCSRGGDCVCSVPVNECSRCGESDYGTAGAEAEVIADCELTYRDDGPKQDSGTGGAK